MTVPRQLGMAALLLAALSAAVLRTEHVAVVGSGGSGSAAVATLQKEFPGRFHVTLLEAKPQLGGVMHTARFGKDTDWNGGMANMGIVVAYRSSYPHVLDFLHSEGIPTRQDRVTTYDYFDDKEPDPYLYKADAATKADANAGYRKLLTSLYTFKGSYREYMDRVAPLILQDDRVAAIWPSTNRSFFYSTASMDSGTDHFANILESMNFTGAPVAESPHGGWGALAEAAARYADVVELGAEVTGIQRGRRPRVAWTQDGQARARAFDRVILTAWPRAVLDTVDLSPSERSLLQSQVLREAKDDYYIVAHSDARVLPQMQPEWRGEVPFHYVDDQQFTIFQNGAKPPYVSYFHNRDEFRAAQQMSGVPDPQTVAAEWDAPSWVETQHRADIGKFLRRVSGVGGVHYAGVWTGAGRWLEGAWMTGVRAAREVAGERWAARIRPRSEPLGRSLLVESADCKDQLFDRYALWMFENQEVAASYRAPVPLACYARTGEVPSYFASTDEYSAYYQGFDRYDRGRSFAQMRVASPKPPRRVADARPLSTFDDILESLRDDGVDV